MISFPLSWQLLMSICCLIVVRAQDYTGEISPPYTGAQLMSVGIINDVTCDDQNSITSGGSITVDGIRYIIPKNQMLVTPNQNVMWSELWVGGVLQMPLWPEVAWEASIFGNEINGTLYTGMVFIMQASARIITGFISDIDTETGNFWISGSSDSPGTGIKAKINDPIGRFGLPYTDHPLWAADTENPSITSISAMPLCIQRPFGNLTDDPLCPSINRPRRADGSAHTMINFLPAAQRNSSTPDPNFFVPLAIGDYVTVLGTIVEDNLLSVYNLIANIGIFTPPGELPVYMYADRNQFSIQGPAAAETGETRAVAFTTDPTTPITWFAVDLDPCTGAATWRNMLKEQPLANIAGQQPGKTVFRGGTLDFSPPPMYTGFKTETGMKITNNSIVAGVYIAPINGFANGYIFAEVTVFGDKMFALEFQDMTFIAQGWGPYKEGNPLTVPMENPPIISQLDPWPGNVAPVKISCKTDTESPLRPSPAAVSDVITSLTVTFARTRGQTAYTVMATDSVVNGTQPVLTVSGAQAQNPVSGIIMDSLGDGMFMTVFSTHNQLDSVTVVSSLGGTATWIG